MDWHYIAGSAAALEKLGTSQLLLPYSLPNKSKNLFKTKPGLVFGALTGLGLAGSSLLNDEEPHPRMEQPQYEVNPLLANINS